jgi:organic hydroperoxide reductase OsmC/OhrA
MRDLSFDAELTWAPVPAVRAPDRSRPTAWPLSCPGLGRWAVAEFDTKPEELLACAVSSCYTAKLFAVLRRAQLPVESLAVGASGTVTGFPAATRFARIVVTPTV